MIIFYTCVVYVCILYLITCEGNRDRENQGMEGGGGLTGKGDGSEGRGNKGGGKEEGKAVALETNIQVDLGTNSIWSCQKHLLSSRMHQYRYHHYTGTTSLRHFYCDTVSE